MDQTYGGDYTGTELDPGLDLDFDFEDDDEEEDSILPLIGAAAGAAALLGVVILLRSRRRKKGLAGVLEEAQHQADAVGKAVKKGDFGKAVAQVDLGRVAENVDLSGMLHDARGRVEELASNVDAEDLARQARRAARQAAKQARQAVSDADLQGTIDDLRRRLETVEREGSRRGRKFADEAGKRVAKVADDVSSSAVGDEVGSQIANIWSAVSKRANEIGWEDAFGEAQDQVAQLTKRARKQASNLPSGGDVNAMLGTLRDRVGDAIENLREDVLPEVQDRVESDFVPGAKKLAGAARKRGEELAGEARKRGGDLATASRPAAEKAVEQTGGFIGMLTEVLRNVAMDAINRTLNDAMPAARKGGAQAADVLRDQTAPWVRHRAGEVRDRIRDDVGPKVGDAVAAAPGTARDMFDTAGPAVADAFGDAAARVREAVDRARPKVAEAVESSRDTVGKGGGGIGGAISGIGQRAGDTVGSLGQSAGNAVSTTVDTTKYITGESSRIMFWLSMLSALIALVFIPDRDKQQEIWHNVQGFIGELREMWGDFSDEDFADEDAEFGTENAEA